ncbi:MAG: PD40 domain-containing protein [Labilithrix sp.]|nr:PD40 domain-containing protein [Labilithrix sp.]
MLLTGLIVTVAQAGCGSTGDPSTFANGTEESGGGDFNPPGFVPGDGANNGSTDGDPDALGALIITPPTATIAVTIANGVVTVNTPVTFTASYNSQPVAAQWLFDRGELGDISSTGVFTASAKNVGEGTVTARFGAREGTAKVKITVVQTQNGALAGADAGGGGFGGLGGVGGEPLGGDVDPAIVTRLKTQSNPPATPAELGFLYPYDKTVWPRGLLPPLLMWQTTREATSVWVKLSQGNFSYEGTFSYAAQPANGNERKRIRLEDAAWRMATAGNQGDALKVEVKIYSTADDKVYGPITETWKVAPGVLKGTVYYNSYESILTTGGGAQTGGVIAIKPRSPDPVLAVPSEAGKCHVCHTVSADGSTLWAQDENYVDGASYNLTAGGARTPYLTTGAGGSTANRRKFVWSAPYPDGSFALASSRFAREAYLESDAKLFARANGAEVASTGLSGVVASAVTPAFSPDGRKVAFNFWTGTGAGGVTAGAGRSLAVFDFTCGAPAGSTTCPPAGARAFSGLRELYRDPARFPAWPTFFPDGKAVIFHNQLERGTCSNDNPDPASIYNCHLTTWYSAKADLWIARDNAAKASRRLDAANGVGYAPTNGDHPNDAILNYNPTVNPVASGGYYWVVFTSRRIYGNLLTGPAWGATGGDGTPQKKLWVAAIDINDPAGGADPSHPAFYLPGQELGAGNTRGFWVVDPCKPNGTSCESGDECCNGFCRKDPDGGALVCMDKPPGTTCVQEFEKCTVDADCCDPKQKCVAGKCSLQTPVVN